MCPRWPWIAIALLCCCAAPRLHAQQDLPEPDAFTSGQQATSLADQWAPELRVAALTDEPAFRWQTVTPASAAPSTPRLPAPQQELPRVDPGLAQASYQQPQDPQPAGNASATQEPAEAPAEPATPPDRLTELQRQVEAQKKLIQDNQSLDDTSRTRALEQLTQAEVWLQKASRLKTQIQTETAAKASFPRRLKELQERKEQAPKTAQPDLEKPLETLQGELQTRQQTLQKLQEAQKTNKERLAQVTQRGTQLPQLQSAAAEALKEVESKLDDLGDQPDEIPNTVQRLELQSEQLALQKEVEALELEVERQKQITQILPLEEETLAKEIRILNGEDNGEITAWRKAVKQKRNWDIQEQQRNADAAARTEFIQNNPVLSTLAGRNQELAQQRSMLTSQIDSLRIELETVGELNQKVELSRAKLEQKIAAIGLTSTTGMLLIDHRRSLPPVAQSQERLSQLSTKLRDNQSLALSLKDEQQQIEVEEEYIEALLAEQPGEESEVRPVLTELVQTQMQYLKNLLGDYDTYREEISQVVVRYRQLISNIEESKAYVDRTALWVRSTKPLAGQDLSDARLGLGHLLQPRPWMNIAGGLGRRLGGQPHELGILMLVLIGLFVVQRRLR